MKRMVTEEQLSNIDGETPESLSVDGNNIVLGKKNGEKLTAPFSSGSLYRHDVVFYGGAAGGSGDINNAKFGFSYYSTSSTPLQAGDVASSYLPKFCVLVSDYVNSKNKYYIIAFDKTSGYLSTSGIECSVGNDGSVTQKYSSYFISVTVNSDTVTSL